MVWDPGELLDEWVRKTALNEWVQVYTPMARATEQAAGQEYIWWYATTKSQL